VQHGYSEGLDSLIVNPSEQYPAFPRNPESNFVLIHKSTPFPFKDPTILLGDQHIQGKLSFQSIDPKARMVEESFALLHIPGYPNPYPRRIWKADLMDRLSNKNTGTADNHSRSSL
jgi:hypothetical protein